MSSDQSRTYNREILFWQTDSMQLTAIKLSDTTLRWVLGGLFIWAGVVKLSAPRTFAQSIDAFGLLPEALLPPVALLLPVLEVVIGLAVLRRWRGGLPAMAGLLLMFMAVLGYGIGQNLDVDCGCFSLAEVQTHTSLKTAFLRDLVMLAGVTGLGLITRATDRMAHLTTRGIVSPTLPREEKSS
jgi:uncharacterized membrane protein YphA (DoxX/SURF4 family)